MWKELGATRVVAAREVSLADLKEMKDNVDIEIESFVHGSMCISYSGRCLLSNYMTGNRDANRGQCFSILSLEIFPCGIQPTW